MTDQREEMRQHQTTWASKGGAMSDKVASRMLCRNARGAFVAVIKPVEITATGGNLAAANGINPPHLTPKLDHVPEQFRAHLEQLFQEFHMIFC